MSQSQSEGATMNLRPNLDPRILPGFYSAIRTQSSIDYSKQLTVFWRFQIFKSASTSPMRFTQFRAFLAVTTSLAHHDHMSTGLAHNTLIYPVFTLYVVSLLKRSLACRSWIFCRCGKSWKSFILWLRHMEALQRRVLAVPHQILRYFDMVKRSRCSSHQGPYLDTRLFRGWEIENFQTSHV